MTIQMNKCKPVEPTPEVEQEPVGYVSPRLLDALLSGKACGITMEDKLDARNGVTIPLFAAPQPAEQQSAPNVQMVVAGWQFYQDGKWWHGSDRTKLHRKNTEAAGIPVRDVYATAQPVEQPECGCCGQTVQCDPDCDAVIFRKAAQQPVEQQSAPNEQMEWVGWQFYQDGKWWNGDDRIKDHRKNTAAAGIPIREVYATAQPAECSQFASDITETEKERRLTRDVGMLGDALADLQARNRLLVEALLKARSAVATLVGIRGNGVYEGDEVRERELYALLGEIDALAAHRKQEGEV